MKISGGGISSQADAIKFGLARALVLFDQNFSKDTRRGLMVEVMLEGNDIVGIVYKEIAFNEDYQPYLVPSEQ